MNLPFSAEVQSLALHFESKGWQAYFRLTSVGNYSFCLRCGTGVQSTGLLGCGLSSCRKCKLVFSPVVSHTVVHNQDLRAYGHCPAALLSLAEKHLADMRQLGRTI